LSVKIRYNYNQRRSIIKKITNDKEKLIKQLTEIQIFQNLDKKEVKELIDSCEFTQYEDKETIIAQNEMSTFLCGILQGEVEICIKDEDGKHILLATVNKGDICGEASIFMDVKRTADVIAKGTVQIVNISREKLINFVNKTPKAGLKIFAYIIFSLIHKLKGANKEILFEKQSTVTAKDLEKLKVFFPSTLEDYL